jgi:hypothetical protein
MWVVLTSDWGPVYVQYCGQPVVYMGFVMVRLGGVYMGSNMVEAGEVTIGEAHAECCAEDE